MKHALILISALLLALPAAAQPCNPAQVPTGTGTPARIASLADNVVDGQGRKWEADVLWYYCEDPTQPSGWRPVALYCWADKRVECLAQVPVLTAAAIGVKWASIPKPADVGLGWAELMFESTLLVQHRPPPLRWVVATAASNAKPAGTRPTYTYTAPATVAADGQRIAQGSACNCLLSYQSGSTRYCNVDAAKPVRVAACVRA